ncbi:hypothetical protein GCM10009854_27930 [Saccharopolyspora halophila]|uniref:Uncharacterized protein n=1 Tax=Saccharopolyspora halophila TaxID=405551 RepID=A0ABN3GCV2_9PSEU
MVTAEQVRQARDAGYAAGREARPIDCPYAGVYLPPWERGRLSAAERSEHERRARDARLLALVWRTARWRARG